MRGEFVDLRGLRLYYYAAGTRGAGDPVLLLHGFATSAHLWRQIVPRVPAGHRVIAVDLPGHGRSEPFVNGDCSAAAHARLINDLLADLRSGPVHVVAHGFGCEIAVQLAALPERARSLLLLAPAGDGQGPAAVPGRRSLAASALRVPWRFAAVEPLRRYLARGFTDRAVAERSLGRHLQWFGDGTRRTALSRQLQSLAGTKAAPVSLEQPLEVIAGSSDPFISARRAAVRFLGPGRGTLTTLGGERHFLPEEAPDAVARVLARLLAG